MKIKKTHIIKTPSTNYLDKSVSTQKRQEHLKLINNVLAENSSLKVLKTDLFEEVNLDTFMLDKINTKNLYAVDISDAVIEKAGKNIAEKNIVAEISKADIRSLPFESAFFDVVFSTSTLDHFSEEEEIYKSLDEIGRVLKREGKLVITLDNPANPMYYLLKLLSFCKIAPFYIGKTLSTEELNDYLDKIGFTVLSNTGIIHNPRVISTLLFKLIRLVLGRDTVLSDKAVNFFLKMFSLQRKTFLAKYSACFITAVAIKK